MENLQPYNNHISNQAEIISSLLAISGIQRSADYVQLLWGMQAFQCYDIYDQVATRVIYLYLKFQSEARGGIVTFDQNFLASIVEAIDRTPHLSGYMYDTRLQQDCQILFPKPVRSDGFWEDIIAPIQRFHANRLIVSNPLVITGLGLYLIIMISSIGQKNQLESFNFTPIIYTSFFPPNGIVDTLPLQIANSISSELAIRRDSQALIPASIIDKIEEEVANV